MQIRALALDAFGTLIQYGQRLAPYSRLVGARGEGAARLPFLTRDVPVATFAAELGMEHLLPDIEADLAEELAGLRLFAEVPQVLALARAAGLRLAVCSNLAAEYGPAVRGLLPNLDAYVLSYEVGLASLTRPSSSACATRWAARLVRWLSWATPSAATWTAREPSVCRPITSTASADRHCSM